MDNIQRNRGHEIAQLLLRDLRFENAASHLVATLRSRVSANDFEETIKRFSDGQPGNVYSRTGSVEADRALNQLADLFYSNGYSNLRTDTQVRRACLAYTLNYFTGAAAAGEGAYSGNPTNQKDIKMDNSKTAVVKVEQVTRVAIPGITAGPVDAKLLSTDQLIAGISATEKQIKELKAIETASEGIKNAITKLEDGAKALAGVLDSRLADENKG